MEKTDKKQCTNIKCKSSNIREVSKIENFDAIVRSKQREYPKFTNVFYQCECNECGELFEYWPVKN